MLQRMLDHRQDARQDAAICRAEDAGRGRRSWTLQTMLDRRQDGGQDAAKDAGQDVGSWTGRSMLDKTLTRTLYIIY